MKRGIVRCWVFICLLLVGIFKSFPLSGCSTPVFRYALERWTAFSYVAEVIHDGHLDEKQKSALAFLKASATGKEKANLRVREIIASPEVSETSDSLPLVRLFYPPETQIFDVLWQGPLTMNNAKRIIDSPARRKMVNHIQRGDAIVWIFLQCENGQKNETSSRILGGALKKLSSELRLSASATDASGEPLKVDVINRKLHFSMVTLSRNNPDEEIFVRMLLGTEPDLPYVKSPLAFPVFGRGRLLYALAGRGIKFKMIETACSSVIGWCSCTVKEDNPGHDLLMRANWDIAMGDSSWIKEEPLPEITGVSGFGDLAKVQENVLTEKQDPLVGVQHDIVASKDVLEEETSTAPEKKEAESIESANQIIENENGVSPPEATRETTHNMSPLVRNSLLMVGAILICILLVLRFLNKKDSKS